MRMKLILLAGAAALTCAGCGGSETGAPETRTSAAALKTEAASPLDREFRLSGAEAVDVDALFALLGDDVSVTYDKAEFDEKLGAMVVANLRVEGAGAGPEIDIEGGLTADRAEFYGVDPGAIERVRSGDGAVDAPFEPIFQKARFFGVKPLSSDDGSTLTIGGIELDQLRLRQGGAPEAKGDQGDLARVFNAFDLSGLYFKDLSVEVEENESGAFSFSAPDLRLVGLGGGKLAAVIANDVEYELEQSEAARAALTQNLGPAGAILNGPLSGFIAPGRQRSTFESLEWRGIDFSGLMGYGLKNEKPPYTAKNLIDLGTMKAQNAETFIAGRRASHADEVTVSAMKFTWLAPSKIRMETKGAQYDFTAYAPESEEQAISVLKSHGLDKVTGSSDLAWNWDADKGDADLKADFDTEGLADFSMAFDLGGLELEKIGAASEAGDEQAILKAGLFRNFSMKLADEKLLDAVYDIAAIQMGGAGDDLRQSAPAMVRLSGAQASAVNPRFAGYVDAIADFVGEGGTLEIEAKPEKPVPLETIAKAGETGPDSLPDLINLNVTHITKE